MDQPSGSPTRSRSPALPWSTSSSTGSTSLTPHSVSSAKRKGSLDKHGTVSGYKRLKPMGRPKNGWTPSKKRKLVRLYVMTELDVGEIAAVIQAKRFQPWLVAIYSTIPSLSIAQTLLVNEIFRNNLTPSCKHGQTKYD